MRILKPVIMFILVAWMTSIAWAQPQHDRRYEETIGIPQFHLDAITFLSEDPTKTKVVFYIQIMYDNLQFIQSNRGYEATYDIDFSILAGDDAHAPRYENRIWQREVVTFEYEMTNSRERFDVTETIMDLPPGNYFVIATLKDRESRLESEARSRLTVPSYNEPGLQLGDLVLAKHVRIASDGSYEIVPNVDRVIRNTRAPLFVYYEVYPRNAEVLDVYYRVMNEFGEIVRETSFNRTTSHPITRDFFQIDISDLDHGNYVVEMQVRSGSYSSLKGLQFRVQMAGLPATVTEIDEAIRQLRYIASRRRVRDLLNARSLRKEEAFRNFWATWDPTPGTPRNELMDEYFWRIEQANQLFGNLRPGWETDRGEVYVRFGPPSDVERHPFNMDTNPYEIWYYYDSQRRFVFVDEMGFGDYRLVSPLWQ